jgi:hypothetical protein
VVRATVRRKRDACASLPALDRARFREDFAEAVHEAEQLDLDVGRHDGPAMLASERLNGRPLGFQTKPALALSDGVLAKLELWWQRSRVRNRYKKTAGRGRQLGSKVYVMNWLMLCTSLVLALAYWPTLARQHMEAGNEFIGWKAVDFVVSRGEKLDQWHDSALPAWSDFRCWGTFRTQLLQLCR